MSKTQAILDALEVLKANRVEAAVILKDLSESGELLKSTLTTTGSNQGVTTVADLWTAGQDGRVSREQILTGPGQSASGAGAERMNRDYSNNAAQRGIQLDAEALGKMFAPAMKAMQTLAENQEKISKAMDTVSATVLSLVAKAKDDDDKDHDEMSKSAAKAAVAKATSLLGEADNSKGAKAARLVGEARGVLIKAQTILTAFPDAEIAKAIDDLANDYEIKLVKAEDKKDDDDEEMKKAEMIKSLESLIADATDPVVKAGLEETLAKAKGPMARGNQADRKDAASGNQDDAAVKAKAEMEAISKSLQGEFAGLTMKLNGLMELMAHASKNSGGPPVVIKSQGEGAGSGAGTVKSPSDLLFEIEKAEGSGTIMPIDGQRAREAVNKLHQAKAGVIGEDVANDYIQGLPHSVRSIFEKKAA